MAPQAINPSFKQHTLDISIQEKATFENYCVGDNRALYQQLLDYSTNEADARFNPTVLWGEPGVGRTHLLNALCNRLHGQHGSASVVYLPFNEHKRFEPSLLTGIEMSQVVCWDDVDAVIGQKDWEHALFHAYNKLQQQQRILCISTRQPFKTLAFTLPDLLSRLLHCSTFQVQPLNDVDKANVLKQHACARGLTLNDTVINYLFRYYSRDMHVLMPLLKTLDQASLAQGRCALSTAFVKSIIEKQVTEKM